MVRACVRACCAWRGRGLGLYIWPKQHMGRHSAPPSHWRRRRLHIEHWTFYILHELWLRTLPILLLFTLGPCGRVFFWHGWLVGWLDVMHPHPLIWFKLCTFPARCAAFYSLSLSRARSPSLSARKGAFFLSFASSPTCTLPGAPRLPDTALHATTCTVASWHCLACYHMHVCAAGYMLPHPNSRPSGTH